MAQDGLPKALYKMPLACARPSARAPGHIEPNLLRTDLPAQFVKPCEVKLIVPNIDEKCTALRQ